MAGFELPPGKLWAFFDATTKLPPDPTVAAIVADRVAKGDLVFNVKDYGAAGNWTSGTSGTDDTAAINACLTAAGAAGSADAPARVLVPWTTGNGYKFTSAITTPQHVEWDMRADLVYCGSGGEDALTVGTSTATRRRWHRIRVRRYAPGTWASESDRGVVLRNHYLSSFEVVTADNFTIGLTCIGDTGIGFSYNKVFLGSTSDNKVQIDLTNDTGGWCNENDFYGGRLAVSSTTNTTLDRIGVRSTSRATSKYYNNANVFHKPCFELNSQSNAGNSICALMEYATAHSFLKCRSEANDPTALQQENNSHSNEIDFTYSDLGANRPVLVNNSASSSGRVRLLYEQMIHAAQRVIYRADAVHKKACYYDGGTSVNLPGLTVGTSATGNTDARAASSITMAADYVEFGSGRYAGFYMSTRNLKRFTVFRDCEAGYGGRIIIRAYDSSGSIISTAGTVKTTSPAATPTYGTGWGGAWRMGTDSNSPYDFQVSASTDFVFIGVTGGTADCRLRSLSVAAVDTDETATWLAFPDDGDNYATTPPTSGTWAVGRKVVNAAPAPGSPALWVCTSAGTPGTWTPVYAGPQALAPDVQVFTSSGTWTKPSGVTAIRGILIGGGGGGGSGRRGAAGSTRCGGGGGAGGGLTHFQLVASDVGSTVTVTVGGGGAGAAGATANDTNGATGTAGAATTFGTYARAPGGNAGTGGTASAGTGGSAGTGTTTGGAGGAANTSGGAGGNGGAGGGPSGGGAGGGISTADTANIGGTGYSSQAVKNTSAAGGAVDSTSPVAGDSAAAGVATPGGGGGGGAGSITTTAQAGAAGGNYGGGGGGGGASLNGNNSGAGGAGGAGLVVIVSS